MSTDVITIVSGLPRSGTSMMMRMLEVGGIPPLTDSERAADEDNPNGYYEFERVKKLPNDVGWLPDARGKAVKMVFTLLHELPAKYQYRVIFMRRTMTEILASQRTMLERQGKDIPLSDAEIGKSMQLLLDKTLHWLVTQPNITVEYVWYNDMMQQSDPVIKRINTFCGGHLDTTAMHAVVDSSLYRNRAE